MKTRFYVYYLFDFFLVVNNNKKWENIVDNIIFGSGLTDWPMTIFENTFLCYYLFDFFLVLNKNKNSYYVVKVLIFMIGLPDYSMTTVQITFPRKLKVCLLFSRKQREKMRIYCWQYHFLNRLTGLTYDNLSKHVFMLLFIWFLFSLEQKQK